MCVCRRGQRCRDAFCQTSVRCPTCSVRVLRSNRCDSKRTNVFPVNKPLTSDDKTYVSVPLQVSETPPGNVKYWQPWVGSDMVRVAASMVRCFPVALLPRCVHSGRNTMLLFGRLKVLLGVAVLDSWSVRAFVQYVAASEIPKRPFSAPFSLGQRL